MASEPAAAVLNHLRLVRLKVMRRSPPDETYPEVVALQRQVARRDFWGGVVLGLCGALCLGLAGGTFWLTQQVNAWSRVYGGVGRFLVIGVICAACGIVMAADAARRSRALRAQPRERRAPTAR